MNQKVSLAFATLPDKELDNFTLGVKDGMTDNPAYKDPPVPLPDLEAQRVEFEEKIAKAAVGGPPSTAAKDLARQLVVGSLRKQANFVEGRCNNDLTTLLESGFKAANTDRRSEPLPQPTGLRLKNGNSGELVASVDPIKNTRLYEGRAKGPTGDWMPSVFSGDSRRIILPGLVPGTIYTTQVRALGGSTGQSDWSDPSSRMAM